MTTAERAEINRRNAQKSTGPRTPEGKERAKFNALKHGMAAKTSVLPGEDAEAYRGRIDAWTFDFRPRNEVEQALVEQAARVSWQLARVEGAQTARLTNTILTAVADEGQRVDDEVAALGCRLFQDPRGLLPLDPRSEYQPGQPSVSCSDLTGDPNHPAPIVRRLESTSAGCRWLLDRWAELRTILDQGLAWQPPDQLKAIHLLGAQPFDAAEASELARRLSFDDSPEGEQLRRYQMDCGRSMLRTFDTLLKNRRAAMDRNPQPIPRLTDRSRRIAADFPLPTEPADPAARPGGELAAPENENRNSKNEAKPKTAGAGHEREMELIRSTCGMAHRSQEAFFETPHFNE